MSPQLVTCRHIMELHFHRTTGVALAGNDVPVTIWRIERADKEPGQGLALIAEIVPLPQGHSSAWSNDALRTALWRELSSDGVRLELRPIPYLVSSAAGTPARIWLGHTGCRIPIAAFVVTLT